MNCYIKVKYLSNGIKSDKAYTFKTDFEVSLGDIVNITEKIKGVVTGYASREMIIDPNTIKSIVGKAGPVEKIKIGDKVKVITTGIHHGFYLGEIVTVTELDAKGEVMTVCNEDGWAYVDSGDIERLYIREVGESGGEAYKNS